MIVSSLYPGLGYDHVEGSFWRLKKTMKDHRRVFPDDAGYICYSCAFTEQLVKKKACRVAWEILHNISSAGMYVVHRNLDENDFKGFNLLAIDRQEYIRFKDASYNLNKIQLRTSGKDAFSYKIVYKKDGKSRYKMLHDVVAATRFKRFLQYCALKYLGKYLNTG